MIIFYIAEHLKLLKDNKSEYTLEQAIEGLTKVNELRNLIIDKYD